MDSSNPSNPNANISGTSPEPQNPTPAQGPAAWVGPTPAPQAPVALDIAQSAPAVSSGPASPWDQPSVLPAPGTVPENTAPGFMPSAPSAGEPPVQSPFPPASPWQALTPASESANPFLQPQTGASPLPENPASQPPPVPNPMSVIPPDPLNTAFTPASPGQNPFGQPQIPSGTDTAGANPLQSPQQINPGSTGAQPGSLPSDNANIQDQVIPGPQSGTLDLSSLNNPDQAARPSQPGNPLPDMAPTENAPTDLSHLIAGDDQSTQQPGNVYTPPVAADQNPAVIPTQAPSPDDQTPPPGKHLNLTKVLLVAGIPIILIVAALSAYLILGIGKTSPSNTSLPVEQVKQDQAPLTNPPQQITAPSPAAIPEPIVTDLQQPSSNPSPSPEASLSPAMKAALKKASASSPTSSTNPSPQSSASTSLPTN